ncbi:MAG: hypothetical protein K9J28_01175 [Sulfuritalea sp.]|jgi:hypothetical protein|nr:hypothetical protein [Sulfuritalea sp.]
MWRLIFLALIIWCVIYFFKEYITKTNSKETSGNEPTNQKNVEDGNKTEDMVQCATCQVHLPRSEAFLVANKFYCSKAHIKNK